MLNSHYNPAYICITLFEIKSNFQKFIIVYLCPFSRIININDEN